MNVPEIEPWEVEHAVKTSTGNAPGPDNVAIDLMKAAGDEIYDKLAKLFNEFLKRVRTQTAGMKPILFFYSRKVSAEKFQNTVKSISCTISTKFFEDQDNQNNKNTA